MGDYIANAASTDYILNVIAPSKRPACVLVMATEEGYEYSIPFNGVSAKIPAGTSTIIRWELPPLSNEDRDMLYGIKRIDYMQWIN